MLEGERLKQLFDRGVPIRPLGEEEDGGVEGGKKGGKIPLSQQGRWKAEKGVRLRGTKPKEFVRYDALPSAGTVNYDVIDNEDPEAILIRGEEEEGEKEDEEEGVGNIKFYGNNEPQKGLRGDPHGSHEGIGIRKDVGLRGNNELMGLRDVGSKRELLGRKGSGRKPLKPRGRS